MTQMMISKSFVHFAITHNISSSKGWGRYKAAANGCPLVQSSTGNEWVSAAHSGEIVEGSTITATLQTMERVGKMKKETIASETYTLVAAEGQQAEIGCWNGLQVVVTNARRA